ncbi:MAG: hypothetical protein ACOX8H_12395 [Ruminococcus sp.]
MSDYRRFISYLYEYKNGQKTQSRGFLKAESRNNMCKLEIHIKDSALIANLPIDIYGFTREENRLLGVFLGTTKSGNGAAGCCVKTSSSNLNNSSVPFSSLKGIIILCSDTVCYASAWDDLPIVISDFTKTAAPFTPPKTAQQPSSSSAAPASENPSENPAPQSAAEEPSLETEEVKYNGTDPGPALGLSQRWERAAEQFEPFQPFTDGFLSHCLKLTLKDLAFLRRERWIPGTNPFMIHSFSKNQHLILGQLEDSGSFILGVPGSYHPKEKFMAEMYGFPYFKATKFSQDSSPSPGYWYRILE